MTPLLPTASLLLILFLATGCATGAGPAGGRRYGVESNDAFDAAARGEGNRALAYYEGLAAERDLGRTWQRVEAAKAYNAATIVARMLGVYQRAIRNGLRAMELVKTLPDSPEAFQLRMAVHSSLGFTYAQFGDFDEARRQFETMLEAAGGHSAIARIGLSTVAYLQGDYPTAIREGRAGVGMSTSGGRWASRGTAWALTVIGRAEWALGNLDGAERSLREAVNFARSGWQTDVELIARASLSDIAYRRGDLARAEREAKELLAEGTRLNLFFFNTLILSHLGVRAAERGRHEEALVAYGEAMRLVEEVRSWLQEGGLRGLFLENRQGIYHGAVSSALAVGKTEEAFSFAERGRARAFLDLLGSQTVTSKGKTRALVQEELRLRARLSEARALAQDVASPSDPARVRQQVETVEREYRAFLDRVRQENLEQASLMTVEPVTLREVQGFLPEGMTLLEYLVTETETVLWVIDRQRVDVKRLPVGRGALVARVREFRSGIAEQASIDQIKRQAHALYEGLFAPAREQIRGDRLLIVPHDVLHYLPFGALRSPEGRWLVEDYVLATLPSASVLKYLRGKGEGASARVLVLGNPDVGPALNLRYAEREARAVAKRYPGAVVLTRQEATETRARALSGEVGLLHFATHAELSELDPLSSALLLVPDETEDGRLEVREIFGLDLKARLVVLSACETGLGRLSKGDELVGLQRAFLYAGAAAVVTTLWKVDDRASFVLMREFYDELAVLGPAEALRKAQSRVMQEFPHPFAWAGFGVTGVPG